MANFESFGLKVEESLVSGSLFSMVKISNSASPASYLIFDSRQLARWERVKIPAGFCATYDRKMIKSLKVEIYKI